MEQLTSGLSVSERRRISLDQCLHDAISRTEPRLPKPRLASASGQTQVVADRERLTTVLEHLIRNAQDATPEHGEVSVDVAPSGDTIQIRINDTGCGMDKAFIRSRLFRPFDSTKGSQSMGIGAYQAREYVRELGGYLAVASEPGQGTTFTVVLPLAEEPA